MKKFFITLLKSVVFFIGWIMLASFIPVPDSSNPAVWRFFAELIPLLCVAGMTLIFEAIEKRKIKAFNIGSPARSCAVGFGFGAIWLGCVFLIMMLSGVLKLESSNKVDMLWLWILSALINTVMQELLVRGYLYQMIKSNYNIASAAIVTTVLFTLMHGGAFEAGVIPVLNVISMSLLMTAVLEYTNSLLAPIIMHFLWNCIGAIVLGCVSLADDYPHLLTSSFSGNALMSGGIYKIEGSIAVLFANIILIAIFVLLCRKNKKNLNKI